MTYIPPIHISQPKHWMDFQVPLEINGAQVGTVEVGGRDKL